MNFLKRLPFLAPLCFIVLSTLPLLRPNHIPLDDTLETFQVFHYFYSEFFFHNEWPQWMPYYTMGIPASCHQQFALSAPSYLLFAIGKIFSVKDVAMLFKMTVFIEQLFLLSGMYLLCSLFFSRKTTFILCLSAVGFSFYTSQIFFNFRIFFLFPLALYCLMQFFFLKQSKYFWFASLTTLAWMQGSTIYMVCLWFFVLSLFFFLNYLKNKNALLCLLEKSWKNVLLASLTIALAALLISHLMEILNFANVTHRELNGKNSIKTFIGYGGTGNFQRFFNYFIVGESEDVYMGILPLGFFLWSLFFARNHLSIKFLTLSLFIIWLSFGGFFTLLCYFFPGISYYRHIVMIYPLAKIPMLIGAGFGLDIFWEMSLAKKIKNLFIIGIGLVIIADGLNISSTWLNSLSLNQTFLHSMIPNIKLGSTTLRFLMYFIIFILLIFLFAAQNFIKNPRLSSIFILIATGLIIICCTFDITSTFYRQFITQKKLPTNYPYLYTLDAHPMAYQPQRHQNLTNQRAYDAKQLSTHIQTAVPPYTEAYSFWQHDPCRNEYRNQFLPKTFDQLFETRAISKGTQVLIDPDFLKIIGCTSPKLRLVSNATYVHSHEEAAGLVKQPNILSTNLILQDVPKEDMHPNTNNQILLEKESKITVTKFSANSLTANIFVPSTQGAWLVYADNFDKHWEAMVNNKSTPIYKAYLSFKAIFLNAGENNVSFVYKRGIEKLPSYLIFAFGLIFSIILLIKFFQILIFDTRNFSVSKREFKK